jgi:hypothetical protein
MKGKSDSTREVGMLLKASKWGFRELAAKKQSSSAKSQLSTVFSILNRAFQSDSILET